MLQNNYDFQILADKFLNLFLDYAKLLRRKYMTTKILHFKCYTYLLSK